jgi:Protein of unknown function (DUF2785)
MGLRFTVCLLMVVVSGAAHAQSAAASGARHDKAFWQAVIKNDYKVPEGETAERLAAELSEDLGSPDPDLRDETAYDILSTWIYKTHQIDGAALRALTAQWLENLSRTSDPEPNGVLRRSFSALMLSVVVARDNAQPVLERQEFRRVWDGALRYLADERDVRGFDPKLGWIHSAAHTADLLKFLARSRYVEKSDQAALLAGIQRKLTTAPIVFIYGEDERYARTALSVIMRKDFDADSFAEWAKGRRPVLPEGTPTEQALHSVQNVKNFLAKFDFILSLQTEQQENVKAAEAAVRDALKNTF